MGEGKEFKEYCVVCSGELETAYYAERNVGQCLYRKQYMYGDDGKCANYVPLPAHPEGE